MKTSGMAVASLVVGIGAFCLGWIPILGLIVGLVAVILGAVAMKKIDRDPMLTGKGLAVAGLVIGIILSLWGAVYLVLFLLGVTNLLNELDNLEEQVILVASWLGL